MEPEITTYTIGASGSIGSGVSPPADTFEGVEAMAPLHSRLLRTRTALSPPPGALPWPASTRSRPAAPGGPPPPAAPRSARGRSSARSSRGWRACVRVGSQAQNQNTSWGAYGWFEMQQVNIYLRDVPDTTAVRHLAGIISMSGGCPCLRSLLTLIATSHQALTTAGTPRGRPGPR